MVKVIRVPKTPRSAYDPERKVSNLLKAHIVQLESARQKMYGSMQSGLMPVKRPRNEGQASAYIAELTQLVHPPTESAAAAEAAAVRPAGYEPPPVAPVAVAPPSRARSRKKPAKGGAKAAGRSAKTVRRSKATGARRAKE